jgi:DNA polymerase (family 10)
MTEKASFGAAILYFTGSKEFNVKLRQMAIRKGWKLNEYGIFKGERMLAGATEEEMLGRLGLPFIDPELREDTGEVEAALEGKLPRLLTRQDIKGDLHVHSHWSDGSNSIEEMATAGRRLGYSYIASTDHSQSLRIAGGLGAAELRKKKREIDRLNAKLKGFRVLYGTEVDIDAEGGLDYDDSVLREFDVVVAALHGGFKQPRRRLTARIVAACRNKYVHIIAHPTGRLRGSREEYDLDFPEIFKAARDTNTCLEINAFPGRLDLNDRHSRAASAAGVKLAVDTDSHLISQMENMAYGVAVARRAWLTAGDVINTLPCDRLLEAIRK